jgi:cyanate lyase
MSELPSYCHALLAAKAGTTLTFDDIAKQIGKPEVWTTALFFGQARCDTETAKKVVEVLKMTVKNDYVWGSDPQQRMVTDEMVVDGLAGKGAGSMGVSGMVVRGGTWDGPPKVCLGSSDDIRVLMNRILSCTDCTRSWSFTAGATRL